MAASIFIRRTPMNARDASKVKYDLHPWVSITIKAQPYFFPNPFRPKSWDFEDGVLRRMTKAAEFEHGDIVWFSCSVSISIGTNSWSTELTPIDLIKVGKVPSSMLQGADGYGVPNVDRSHRPDLEEGGVDVPCSYLSFIRLMHWILTTHTWSPLSTSGYSDAQARTVRRRRCGLYQYVTKIMTSGWWINWLLQV